MSVDKVHVMVDIETLDVIPSAVILSIGATTLEYVPLSHWYEELDRHTQYERTISEATKTWWEAQAISMPQGTVNIKDALQNFSKFLSALRAEPIIWCKGTDFDTAILSNAYSQYKLNLPWKYNSVRDFRTVKKLFPAHQFPKNPNAHHALADAVHQVEELKAILKANPNLSLG